MGIDTPKQFLRINQKPIIAYTVQAFFDADPELEIIVVLPESHKQLWTEVKDQYFPTKKIIATTGGDTRFQSVRNGLEMVEPQSLVAIHDAVRPAIKPGTIVKAFETAAIEGSAVVVIPSKDSLRHVKHDGDSSAVIREEYRIVQTPQVFLTDVLKMAYKVPERSEFTDDASVWEAAGNKIAMIEGDPSNIKVTTPEDLQLIEIFLSEKS